MTDDGELVSFFDAWKFLSFFYTNGNFHFEFYGISIDTQKSDIGILCALIIEDFHTLMRFRVLN